jgi:hypothetical protein
MRKILLAVGAGYLVINILTVGLFVALNGLGVDLNQPRWLLVKLTLSLLAGAGGGLVAALVAGHRARPALGALAGLMVVLSAIAVAIKFGSEPLWFQAALIAGAGPAVLAGGLLPARRAAETNG